MKHYTFKLLDDLGIKHAITTKKGGVGIGKFATLNLAKHVGDEEQTVLQNRERVKEFLQAKSLTFMDQIHSNKVKRLQEGEILSCDGLFTDEPQKAIGVMVADCCPVLIYDKQKKVVMVLHAGRAGVFSNIIKEGIYKLQKHYDSFFKNIIVCVGPHIKACCYEVGSEVVSEAECLGYTYAISQRENKSYLDLEKIVKKQLQALGIRQENTEFMDQCSCCEGEFFSYRRQKETGRFVGAIVL